jgi:hypothetical protein
VVLHALINLMMLQHIQMHFYSGNIASPMIKMCLVSNRFTRKLTNMDADGGSPGGRTSLGFWTN